VSKDFREHSYRRTTRGAGRLECHRNGDALAGEIRPLKLSAQACDESAISRVMAAPTATLATPSQMAEVTFKMRGPPRRQAPR
jgi:hypothetical protein